MRKLKLHLRRTHKIDGEIQGPGYQFEYPYFAAIELISSGVAAHGWPKLKKPEKRPVAREVETVETEEIEEIEEDFVDGEIREGPQCPCQKIDDWHAFRAEFNRYFSIWAMEGEEQPTKKADMIAWLGANCPVEDDGLCGLVEEEE